MNAMAEAVAGFARLMAGAQAFRADGGPASQCIYYANHTSHLDAVVLWASLEPEFRARTRPVAAADYWQRSALRRYFANQVFRCVLVDRKGSARAGLQAMLDALDAGDSLIFFPEGTRGSGEEVAEFKAGLYHLCHRGSGIPAVPVYLDNLNRVLPKGEFLPVPLMSRILFGPALQPEPGEDKSAFLERARRELVNLGTNACA